MIESVAPPSDHWRTGGFKNQLLRVVMLLHSPFEIELMPPRWWKVSASLLVLCMAVLAEA